MPGGPRVGLEIQSALAQRMLSFEDDDPVGAQPVASLHFSLASEGTWIELSPGVARKDLGGDPTSASRSYLIRLEAGAHVRTHQHADDEHCYVISGDLLVAGRRIVTGDYHRAGAGSVHESLTSEAGCLLLIVESQAAVG